MTHVFHYSALPDEDQIKQRPPCNPAFRKMVHAFCGKAKLPHLSQHEERNLIGLVQDEGSQDAMEALVESHMGFIVNIAARVTQTPEMREYQDDLVSEGVTGFMKSVERFDLTQSRARLSTYAKYGVTERVHKFLINNIYPFRFGTNLDDKAAFANYARARKIFEYTHARPMQLTDQDLAEAARLMTAHGVNVTARGLARMAQAERYRKTLPVDHIQVHDPDSANRAETRIAARQAKAVIDDTASDYVRDLSVRDRDIIMSVLSDIENRPRLMNTLSRKHGITVERVRQIVRGGLEDIRALLAEDDIQRVSDMI